MPSWRGSRQSAAVISGRTRVFAVLGDPVGHSLSPVMHNAAFRALGLEAVYVALRCAETDVGTLIRAIGAAGGGGNVTIPHKAVAATAVQASPRAARLDACNTFWGSDGAVVGDNTDVDGVLTALRALKVPAGPWLIAGTGGSARAVVAAAAESGVAVAVRSRDAGRRDRFIGWATGQGVDEADPGECTVAINATPLGLSPTDPLPIPAEVGPRVLAALDLVYARGETTWVHAQRARGLRAADGRTMLIAQGAAAFGRWFPGVDAPTEVMRAAVDAALR